MDWDKNRSGKFNQRVSGYFRYVTGFWDKGNCLKSGRISRAGWANMQAFGDDTIFILCENKKRRKRTTNEPTHQLWATKDCTTCETDEELTMVLGKEAKRGDPFFFPPKG